MLGLLRPPADLPALWQDAAVKGASGTTAWGTSRMNRRQMLYGTGAGLLAGGSGKVNAAGPADAEREPQSTPPAAAAQGSTPLPLAEY